MSAIFYQKTAYNTKASLTALKVSDIISTAWLEKGQ
jgi:hypothetical protein